MDTQPNRKDASHDQPAEINLWVLAEYLPCESLAWLLGSYAHTKAIILTVKDAKCQSSLV